MNEEVLIYPQTKAEMAQEKVEFCNRLIKYQFVIPIATFLILWLATSINSELTREVGAKFVFTVFLILVPIVILLNIIFIFYLLIKKREWGKQILIALTFILSFIPSLLPLNFFIDQLVEANYFHFPF